MKKIFLAALAATVLFASCAKEENGVRDNGSEANLDLVISFPKTETRAGQNNYASTQDVTISSVKVFIFNADGTHALGSPSADFTLITDFDNVGSATDYKYALKKDSRINTTAGRKKIYVGINLPTDFVTSVTNEGALINAASTAGLHTASHVAMLSAPITKDLEANVEGSDDTPALNKVDAPVVRLVAKVAATKGGSYNPAVTNATGGGAFSVAADMFTVGNKASHFYPVQRTIGTSPVKLVTPQLATPNNPEIPQKDLNASSVEVKDLVSFYVPELAPSSQSLRREATYAVVRGKLTFNSFAKINATTREIELGTASGHTGDLFVVTQGANTYFCANQTDVQEVAQKLGVNLTEIDTYKDATGSGDYYTFYYLFLNKDDANKTVAVWRNQLIHYTVTGVNGIGVPGNNDDGKPEEPPTTIPDPYVPIFDLPARLEVIVDVEAWSYVPYNNMVLE